MEDQKRVELTTEQSIRALEIIKGLSQKVSLGLSWKLSGVVKEIENLKSLYDTKIKDYLETEGLEAVMEGGSVVVRVKDSTGLDDQDKSVKIQKFTEFYSNLNQTKVEVTPSKVKVDDFDKEGVKLGIADALHLLNLKIVQE